MLACVIPNVSASCETFVPERASSTTCLRTSTGYLLGITSLSLNAGGFQKHDSAKPGSDQYPSKGVHSSPPRKPARTARRPYHRTRPNRHRRSRQHRSANHCRYLVSSERSTSLDRDFSACVFARY